MGTPPVFGIGVETPALVLTPSRNISSLTEAAVQNQWDEIVGLVDQDEIHHVVFDYFGSSMLEAMLFLWKRISTEGGKMAVCNASQTASHVLNISKFDSMWPIHSSRQAALDYVNG